MNQRFIRRNRVDERLALSIAAGSGIAAVFGGAQPTGSAVVDAVLIVLAVGAVVWASASAPWWAVAGAAGIAAVVAFEPIAIAIGALGFLGGLDVGTWRRDQTINRTLVGGVAVNVFIRSDLEVFFGLSALIGVSACTALFVLGLLRRPSRMRRRGWIGVGVTGGVFTISLLFVGLAGVSARPDISSASTAARQGVVALNAGDYEGAADLFEQSAESFGSADGRLGGVLAAPGRLVPAVAQNVAAGRELSAAAADATAEAAGALRQIDISALSVSGGRIDLDAVRAVEDPLIRVQAALFDIRDAASRVESPWLIGRVQDELMDIDEEFSANEQRIGNAIEAVRLAPQMLGGTEARRYLLLFTTPSEARGLGGFVGSFAVLEIDNGALDVTDFGRTPELSTATSGADCSACDPELLQRYGRFGFTTGADGATGDVLFSNVTMPAHFPYVAEAVQTVYAQGPGEPVDGVLVLDPYVVQALMKYSGPIAVPQLDVIVDPGNAAQFILADQYLLAGDKAERVDALDTLGTGAIAAVLSGALPDPPTLAKDLGPLVAERRLLMWTDVPAEQALLDRVGMLGSIPDLDPDDGGFSVSVTNASANKIDVFLDREVVTDVIVNEDGSRRLVADVVLTNNAPTTGLPKYVIGNRIGKPDGFSRLFITFYGPATVRQITLDGVDTGIETLSEAGWSAYSQYVDIPAGATVNYHLEFDLPSVPVPAASDGGIDAIPAAAPVIWEQPLSTR